MGPYKLVISKNVDRSARESAEITSALDHNTENYLAIHLQDITSNIQAEFLPSRSEHFDIQYYKHQGKSKESSTGLISAVNRKLATDIQIEPIGNARAAGLLTKLKLRDKPNSNHIYLINIYIRPSASYTDTASLLGQIYSKSEGKMSRVLITGDVNASSPLWDPNHEKVSEQANAKHGYYQTKIQRGGTITEFIRRHNLVILSQTNRPSRPTFSPKAGPSDAGAFIDIVMAGHKVERIWTSVTILDTIGSIAWPINPQCRKNDDSPLNRQISTSEHRYIIVNSNCRGSSKQAKVRNYTVIRPEMIKKEDFLHLVLSTRKTRQNWRNKPRDQAIEDLEALTNLTMTSIISAQFRSTRIIRTSKSGRRENIISIMRKVRRIQNKLKNLTFRTKLTKPTETMMSKNRIYKRTKAKLISRIKNMCDCKSRTVWDKTSMIRWEDVQALELSQLRDPQSLNELAEKLFPHIECRVTEEQLNLKSQITINDIELETVEKMLRKKNYKGPDDVWFKTFIRCLELIPEIIREIARMSFHLCYIPEHCYETRGTIIPKKTAGKFRIVHVATPLAAYLELIALNRFQFALETHNLLHRDQFGFRCGRGRNELVTRIISSIADHRTRAKGTDPQQKQTTIIGLDIAGAFDNVGQHTIIDQLNKDLPTEPVVQWIKEFMLNRKIKIHYRDVSSYLVKVNKGVPQGSALGPILWNYAIHDIQTSIDKLNTQDTEVLAFADDITIIAHGDQHQKTQSLIDNIIELIESKELTINPDKSESMTITGPGRGTNEWRAPTLSIKGVQIRKVQTMTILGMPLTNKLTLNTKDNDISQKISETKKFLKQVQAYQVIDNMHEWRILIESLLRSILVHLAIPVLAIDEKGRKWSNSKLRAALIYVFGWPRCISRGMISLLTNIDTCEDTVYEQLIQGCANFDQDIRRSYQTLAEIFIAGGLANYARQNQQDSRSDQDDTSDRQTRHHFNPQVRLETCTEISQGVGKLVWIVTNHRHNNATSTILAYLSSEDNLITISEEVIHNTSYRVPYFNMLAAIWKRAQQHAETREIVMHNEESAYRALINYLNRDHRIIKLREELAKNKILVSAIDKATMAKLTDKLKHNKPAKVTKIAINWPNAGLQKEANWRINTLRKRKIQDLTSMLTSTMRELCGVALAWRNIPVDKLNNQTLLMLTGLVSNERKVLTHGEVKTNRPDLTKYPGCSCTLDRHTAANTLKHRLTNCPRYRNIRESIFGAEASGMENIKKINRVILGIDKSITPISLLKKLSKLAM